MACCREALTNVNKHAPSAGVSCTLLFAEHQARLEVVNASGRPADGDLSSSGGGAGLTGLRERLQLVGGDLDAGPEGARWVLTAVCPIPIRCRPPTGGRSAQPGAAVIPSTQPTPATQPTPSTPSHPVHPADQGRGR